MKRIKEINWEARGAWPEKLLDDYWRVSNQVKNKYLGLIYNNEMLDLESIQILEKNKKEYRIAFYIRTMCGNTILGSKFVLDNVPIGKIKWGIKDEI